MLSRHLPWKHKGEIVGFGLTNCRQDFYSQRT
jgi:hypothetical protein